MLPASWEAVERVAEGIRLCKQLVWMGEEELRRPRKAMKGTSWLDHTGQKKQPSPRKSFLLPVHSDTRSSILSHFLSILSLEKLAIPLSPTLLANHSIHGVAVPAEPHIRPPVPQVVLNFSMLWRGDSQKVTMWYRAFSPKEDSEERRTQQTFSFLYLALLGNTTGGAKNYAGRKCNLYPMRIAP